MTTPHHPHGPGRHGPTRIDFDLRPILAFWESTRACLLACRHCRAQAIEEPLPGELSTEEGRALIRSLEGFGHPRPVLIITGGDPLMRADVFDLVAYARERGVPVGLSPAVTSRLTPEAAQRLAALDVKAASLSLDGATAATHEGIRGIEGLFPRTLEALALLNSFGYTLQVNTTVMRDNVEELPAIAEILARIGVKVWEVFFLIHVGRGTELRELSPAEHEDVMHFLFEASRHGIHVRTVEGPFFRRVVAWRMRDEPVDDPMRRYGLTPLYGRLSRGLAERLGPAGGEPLVQSAGTRDGKGIVFVAAEGDIYPAGFLPIVLGNVRRDDLVQVYREHPLLKSIRAARFSGRCGPCDFADACGGSRSRAWAALEDPLGEDPACPYVPPQPPADRDPAG